MFIEQYKLYLRAIFIIYLFIFPWIDLYFTRIERWSPFCEYNPYPFSTRLDKTSDSLSNLKKKKINFKESMNKIMYCKTLDRNSPEK